MPRQKITRTRQLPVRFGPEDTATLERLKQELDQDRAVIIRWAIRYFYQIVKKGQWKVTSRGEPMT